MTCLDESEASDALGQLAGELHPDVDGAILVTDRQFLDALAARFNFASVDGSTAVTSYAEQGSDGPDVRARDPFISLNGPSARSFAGGEAWVTAFGGLGKRSGDGNAATVEASSGGIAGGYDRMVGTDAKVGVALGYDRESISVSDQSSSAWVDTGRFTIYGSTKLDGLTISGIAEYAFHSFDTSRQVNFPCFYMTARADYHAIRQACMAKSATALQLPGQRWSLFLGGRFAHL